MSAERPSPASPNPRDLPHLRSLIAAQPVNSPLIDNLLEEYEVRARESQVVGPQERSDVEEVTPPTQLRARSPPRPRIRRPPVARVKKAPNRRVRTVPYFKQEDFKRLWEAKDEEGRLFLFPDTWDRFHTAVPDGEEFSLRAFNCYGEYSFNPRSAAIPIGESPWSRWLDLYDYPALTIIDEAIEEIRRLATQFKYNEILFPAKKMTDPEDSEDGEETVIDLPGVPDKVSRYVTRMISNVRV